MTAALSTVRYCSAMCPVAPYRPEAEGVLHADFAWRIASGRVPPDPGKPRAPVFRAAFTSLSNSSPHLSQENTLRCRGMAWRWPQIEQSVDVQLGSTLSQGIPAFQALYPSMESRADHRWSDSFLENLLALRKV